MNIHFKEEGKAPKAELAFTSKQFLDYNLLLMYQAH